MPSVNEIITLLNAGYTKADIDQLTQVQAPAPEPEPAPAPAAPAPAAPAPDPEPEEPIQGADKYAQLEAKFNQLIGVMQQQNLNQGIDTLPKRSAQDALAEIIAPPRKEK